MVQRARVATDETRESSEDRCVGERIVAAPGVRVPEERGGGDGDVGGAVEGDAVNRAGGLECGGGEGVR